ncbi:glycosyltransferase family 39 protein [Coleofasciculus sp. FACHB-125]|nr:glycosyltransferase family 39 protein [Coleofasciculus sp. FACHB-125]
MRSQMLKISRLQALLPYLTLLLWSVPLLLFSHEQQSLMAHDEGLYSWRAKLIVESSNWLKPSIANYGKTPGAYWLIASSFSLFGISEVTARIPSIIAGIISVILVYEIGTILLSKRAAWLAAAILSVEFFWFQYSRLAVPDVPMVCMALLGIWSLLKAERHPKYQGFWSFVAGISLGLGFLIRSYMIFLPAIALLPYLIWEHRRHRHLSNPMLYLGFAVGFSPTIVWLLNGWLYYDKDTFQELFQFIFRLSSDESDGNTWPYYFWNVPAKAFPWPFFSLLGIGICLRNLLPRQKLILVFLPLILFVELSFFSTRLPHYALALYPFVALLAGLALDWLAIIYENKSPRKWLPQNLSYAFGGLACLLVLAGVALYGSFPIPAVKGDAQIQKYGAIALGLGLGWLMLPVVWIGRYYFGKKFLTARYWLAAWLVGPWFALAVAGSTGLIGDYNPEIKALMQQPEIAAVLQTHPVNWIRGTGKTGVLLCFYTPDLAKQVKQVSELQPSSYAWIRSEQLANLSSPYRAIGKVREWQLIQVLQ